MKRTHKAKPVIKFRRKLASLFFLAGFGVAGATAQAQNQQPATPDAPIKTFMKQSVFYLPVKIDDRVRATLREVRLYVKEGPNRPWELKSKAAPSQQYFTFRAPHDGEYGFTVVTVDKAGRPSPVDIRKEAPSLIVVQDTQMPQVEVKPLATTDEGTCVQCLIRDANPDLAKTRFFYQTGDMVWRSLNPLPNHPDQFRIPSQAVFTGMVRVEAADLAGNMVSHEINIGTMPAAGTGKTSNPTVAQASATQETVAAVMPTPQKNVPGQFPVAQGQENVGNANTNGPELIPVSHKVNTQAGPDVVRTISKTVDVPATESAQDSATPSPLKSMTGTRHLVNKNHVFLQYQIENKGPSGVGRVAVYLTRDQGQSWQKLGEDRDAHSPIEFDLPSEGLYGVNVVVSNGRGFGGTPPAPGTNPELWIEVDATKPTAELLEVRPATGADAGCVFISWKAHDKNLAAEPIDLYYAVTREGPWQPIAKGIKNEGAHRWQIPANLGSEAFVRLVAHDGAGNTALCETTQGITLDDLSRPRARVISVTTMPPRIN